MTMLIHADEVEQRLIEERQATGADRFDEVWDGVYIMAPIANDGHQRFSSKLNFIFELVLGESQRAEIRQGVNISDRVQGWEKNYRIPDIAVFLANTTAVNHDTFWHGGPDFLVEILSEHEQPQEKLPFYAAVGVREILLIDRDPWSIKLLSRVGNEWREIGNSTPASPVLIESQVIPFRFACVVQSADAALHMRVQCTESAQEWAF